MGKIIGIDLGTTNSCVAVVEGGAPQVIPNERGGRTTPSIVAFTQDGERLVGQIAKRQAVTNPENTVFSVKRLIGRKAKSHEVQILSEHLPYRIGEASGGDACVRLGDRDYSPAEISAFILQQLRAYAEDFLGEPVREAVITVPAYFDDSQRQATKDAGRIAGLDVLRIINEPTAASLAYGLEREKSRRTVAVYDLGGGTFDISLLRLGDGVTEVLATNGNTHLGGDDFDRRILDWLIEQFMDEHDIDLRRDKMALQRLREAAEKAKWDLSTSTETDINLPFIAADERGPKHFSATLDRETFEKMTDELLQMTIDPCRQALDDARLTVDKIDEVILVGGQTRMPRVIELVSEFFGRDACREVNPDEVVAIGAALQAGILGGEVKDLLLLDVTPLSLGIETLGGMFTRLIDRNTTIPTKQSQVFSTAVDNQSAVEVHVLQGEREMAADNRSLGRFELAGIPPSPRGVPQIEVTFSIDANGIVNVSAKDLASGREQTIKVTARSGLTEIEIQRLVAEAAHFADQDDQRKQQAGLRNQLEGLIYTTERSLSGYRDVIDVSLQQEVKDALVTARAKLSEAKTEDMQRVLDYLQQLSAKITAVIFGGKQANA